ncbi:MAG: DUF4169 family protein [Alphaproteobacteria bacterium]
MSEVVNLRQARKRRARTEAEKAAAAARLHFGRPLAERELDDARRSLDDRRLDGARREET